MVQTVTVISKLYADAQMKGLVTDNVQQQRLEEAAEKELQEVKEIVNKPKSLYDMMVEKQTYIDFYNMGWSTVCGDAWIAVFESRLYVMTRDRDHKVKIEDSTPILDKREIVCSAYMEDIIIALREHIDAVRSGKR